MCVLSTCVSYEEEDTCVSYEEEDTCVSYGEEDTCVSYEEEDTCAYSVHMTFTLYLYVYYVCVLYM